VLLSVLPDTSTITNTKRPHDRAPGADGQGRGVLQSMTRLAIIGQREHPRGRLYDLRVGEQSVSALLTFHALQRMERWRLSDRQTLQALLFPEEVLRGHGGRFIAHRRIRARLIRAVYEYDGELPAVITVYSPLAKRYFRGGGRYEDRILA